MNSREFSEWMAFDSIYPIGEERADFRAAVITSVNSSKGPKEIMSGVFDFDLEETLRRKRLTPMTPEEIDNEIVSHLSNEVISKPIKGEPLKRP